MLENVLAYVVCLELRNVKVIEVENKDARVLCIFKDVLSKGEVSCLPLSRLVLRVVGDLLVREVAIVAKVVAVNRDQAPSNVEKCALLTYEGILADMILLYAQPGSVDLTVILQKRAMVRKFWHRNNLVILIICKLIAYEHGLKVLPNVLA